MIRIKVCKLSELMNNAIKVLIFIIVFICVYNLCIKNIDMSSFDFINFSLRTNLGINNKNFIERMIANNLPCKTLNFNDNIEKEYNIADNNTNSSVDFTNLDKLNNNFENNSNENFNKFIIENISDNLNLSPPYLLNCEKISDSKYKLGDVTVNDYTKKKLDLDELEKSLFTKIEEDCRVLIYHTHTSESYTGVQNYSDTFRTEDNNSNVVEVGERLKQELNKYGIFVRHDTTTHDYPSYNGAYKSSLNTVENILKNENYDIIIDVHRDALASNSQYRPTAEINGETVAKLMFVVGTNAAGLKHNNWIENLKFAVAVQQRANELFPGLFRDLHLSTSRYNQHTSSKSVILEVGATGNTINEACLSMKYLSIVLNSMRQK